MALHFVVQAERKAMNKYVIQTLNLQTKVFLGVSAWTKECAQGSPWTKRNPEVKVKHGKVILIPIVYQQVLACMGSKQLVYPLWKWYKYASASWYFCAVRGEKLKYLWAETPRQWMKSGYPTAAFEEQENWEGWQPD